ncbi:unnamed protein product, partial [Nesidiocoris tenuis]
MVNVDKNPGRWTADGGRRIKDGGQRITDGGRRITDAGRVGYQFSLFIEHTKWTCAMRMGTLRHYTWLLRYASPFPIAWTSINLEYCLYFFSACEEHGTALINQRNDGIPKRRNVLECTPIR